MKTKENMNVETLKYFIVLTRIKSSSNQSTLYSDNSVQLFLIKKMGLYALTKCVMNVFIFKEQFMTNLKDTEMLSTIQKLITSFR